MKAVQKLKTTARLFISGAIFLCAEASAAGEIVCPLVLHGIDQHLQTVERGWEVYQIPKADHNLVGLSISQGHPTNGNTAIYSKVEKRRMNGRTQEVFIYDLSETTEPYLICHYFQTKITIFQSLSSMKFCEASGFGGSTTPTYMNKIAKCF